MIRPARPDDLQALCALYFEFHELHVRGMPDRLASLGDPGTFDRSDLCAALIKIVRGDDSALFVAESDDRVVGLAEVYLRHDEEGVPHVTGGLAKIDPPHLPGLLIYGTIHPRTRSSIHALETDKAGHRWEKEG